MKGDVRAGLADLSEVPGVRIGARAPQRGCRVQHREEFPLAAAEVQMVTVLRGELLPAERVPAQVMARERVRLTGHGGRRGRVVRRVSQGCGRSDRGWPPEAAAVRAAAGLAWRHGR